MTKWLISFREEEKGAVTVDWVVLTAAMVGISIVAFTTIQGGSDTMGEEVGSYLSEKDLDELRNPTE